MRRSDIESFVPSGPFQDGFISKTLSGQSNVHQFRYCSLGASPHTWGTYVELSPGDPASETARRTAHGCLATIVSTTSAPSEVPQMLGWRTPRAVMWSTVEAAIELTVRGEKSASVDMPWPRLSNTYTCTA